MLGSCIIYSFLDHLQPTPISISIFSSKIEELYYKGIHLSIFSSIIEISILEENIEVYIGDALSSVVVVIWC